MKLKDFNDDEDGKKRRKRRGEYRTQLWKWRRAGGELVEENS